jgi:hypothetical protein
MAHYAARYVMRSVGVPRAAAAMLIELWDYRQRSKFSSSFIVLVNTGGQCTRGRKAISIRVNTHFGVGAGTYGKVSEAFEGQPWQA